MTGRRLVGASVAVALAAACVACSGDPVGGASGALRHSDEHVAYIPYAEYPVGTVFTDGLERLIPTEGPVTVTGVEWLGSQDSAAEVGWKVAGPGRDFGSVQVSPGFPPTDPGFGPLTDAVGTEISDTGAGHLLLVGIEVVSDGYSVREGIRVTTERDGVTYADDLPAVLVFCGADLTEDQCVARYEADQ